MIRAFIFSLIGSLIFVLGCTESPDISTQTPYPTYTPSATFTPYPTQTPYPTYSPQPIPTNTATATIPVIAPTPIIGSPYVKNIQSDAIEKISYTIRNSGGPPPGYGEKQLETSFHGDLYLPDNSENTVPAVIFIHGTVGVDSRYEFHRETMLEAGIATFELDLKTGIYEDYYSAPDGTRLQSAVYTALEVLQSLPTINPEKIAVMGFSLGGEIAIHISSQIVENRYLKPDQPGFAGHIAFYPGCWWLFDFERDEPSVEICNSVSKDCKYEGKPTGKPIYILAGESDSIREGVCCPALSEVLNDHYPNVATTTLYPDAYHAFDLVGVDHTWLEEIWIGPYGHPYESTVRWNEEVANQSSVDALGFLRSIDF